MRTKKGLKNSQAFLPLIKLLPFITLYCFTALKRPNSLFSLLTTIIYIPEG